MLYVMPLQKFDKFLHTKSYIQEMENEHGPIESANRMEISYMTLTRWRKIAVDFIMNTPDQINDHDYCVYILKCDSGYYYVGTTSDYTTRIYQHNNNHEGKFNTDDFPLSLVHMEYFDNNRNARYREAEWIEYLYRQEKDVKNKRNQNNNAQLQDNTNPPRLRRRRTIVRIVLPEKTEYQKFYEYMKSMGDTNPDHPVYSVWLKSADSPRRKRVLENTITEFIKFKGMDA